MIFIKKYYKVKCKFGHVGRDKYIPIWVPVVATTKKEASKLAYKKRGIKKDHKDWCLEAPIEISKEDFFDIKFKNETDIYFTEAKTRSRKKLFSSRLEDEINYSRFVNRKTNKKLFFKKKSNDVKEFKIRKNRIIEKSLDEVVEKWN